MARKTINYTVADEGRDKGKLFVITEMSAARAEAWAMRVLLSLVGSNVELPEALPEDMAGAGMAAIAEIGFKALGGLRFEVAEPLLAELMSCIKIMPNPQNAMVIRDLVEDDTEEVATRIKLKMEVFKLHTDFFTSAAPSILANHQAAAKGVKLSSTRMSRK